MANTKNIDKIAKDLLQEDLRLKKEENRRKRLILSLAIISVIGFFISFLFLIGITGAAIGERKENFYGLTFIIISLLAWAIAELLWVRDKKKKEVNIKKLLQELEKEGVPINMIYNRYLKD
jgi:hypothetical protein